MCLYLKDKLPCSGSTLVTQNNMKKTVVKGSPVRRMMALQVRKKPGQGSEVTGAKKRGWHVHQRSDARTFKSKVSKL